MAIYPAIRPLLFRLPPEFAHRIGKRALRLGGSTAPGRSFLRGRYKVQDEALAVTRFGKTFPNPVGVAAGFDKNAEVIHPLADIGFGFVEVGTVTPRPQAGNPQPRLFRYPNHGALINHLGFNGDGAERVGSRLESAEGLSIPLGVNIGKMNDSGREAALEDYRFVFDRLYPYPDYFVINVSCPNTPDSFDEQSPEHLRAIFRTILADNPDDKPILVKIGPDSPDASIIDLLDIVHEFDIAGIVATNTSNRRPESMDIVDTPPGGLSGKPLESRSTAVIQTIAQHTDIPIIGVGGVDSAESAYKKLRAGASLIQLYTGLVYRGPSIAREINRGLLDLLERDGFSSVDDVIGIDTD